MHLQRITRRIAPRVENNHIKSTVKERNYLNLRTDHSGSRALKSSTLLRNMVDEEIDKDHRELLTLAGSISDLNP